MQFICGDQVIVVVVGMMTSAVLLIQGMTSSWCRHYQFPYLELAGACLYSLWSAPPLFLCMAQLYIDIKIVCSPFPINLTLIVLNMRCLVLAMVIVG